MLTFDHINQQPKDPLGEAFGHRALPEVIEIGERDDYWIKVNRIKRRIEFISKQTGVLVAFCLPDKAADCGLSEKQIKAAQTALTLGGP